MVLLRPPGNPWEPELIVPMVVIGAAVLVTNYLTLLALRKATH